MDRARYVTLIRDTPHHRSSHPSDLESLLVEVNGDIELASMRIIEGMSLLLPVLRSCGQQQHTRPRRAMG